MNPLTAAHIEAERRLRLATVASLERAWHALPGYDRADIPRWLRTVLPVIAGAQRQSVMLTNGYLARAMDRRPLALTLSELVGAGVRNGAEPAEVYRRPFVTMWTALGEGKQWQDAFKAALARASGTAAMDVQLSMRATAQAVGTADPRIQRFQRVADDGACDFCTEVDGAILNSDGAMPLHDRCGCGIEPLTEDRPITPHHDFAGVAIHEHGELGPVLASPSDHFTHV